MKTRGVFSEQRWERLIALFVEDCRLVGKPELSVATKNAIVSTGVTVRRERRWTSAGATPARELARSTRQQSKRQRRQRSCRSFRCRGSLGDSASVQAIT